MLIYISPDANYIHIVTKEEDYGQIVVCLPEIIDDLQSDIIKKAGHKLYSYEPYGTEQLAYRGTN